MRFNADLANDFGNLAHRAFSMTERWLGGVVPALDPNTEADDALNLALQAMVEQYKEQLEALQFSVAIETLWTFIRLGNKYIDQEQPWRHNREGNSTRLGNHAPLPRNLSRGGNTNLANNACKSAHLFAQLAHRKPFNSDGLAVALFSKRTVARMKELPERIQTLRAECLGEDAAPPQHPLRQKSDTGPKKIKLKVFQRVPFQAGKITVNLS